MREYKFRGLKKDGEWVYGYLVVNTYTTALHGTHKSYSIHSEGTAYVVDPETVGQMIAERDGVEYFEGDTVKYISKEQTGTRVKYKRRGYDTYAEYSDIEVTGVIARGEHDGMLTWIVKTDQCTKYESYFWGEGRRSDQPRIITNNLTKPFSAKRKYEIVGSPHLLEQGEKE
ncbi:hypothetical protein OMP38_14585 [Cohnella ginsengisoli]|uniref:YopX protein domain-containing protein n=1 Tax=Cohnella ginsengisoli TaxID=425004 RepID=A0A9X4QMF9_9BACL|nr:hypothetical protein [Cohnella ginsengisoli]MDG0791944.1 hypothetical protein [Cohnella ginsengisoli]